MTRSEMFRRAFPDGSPVSDQRTDPALPPLSVVATERLDDGRVRLCEYEPRHLGAGRRCAGEIDGDGPVGRVRRGRLHCQRA